MSKLLDPGIGCDSRGNKRPFQILCDGKPWAGFDTYEDAERARSMYQDQPRPKQKHDFTHA